MEKKYIILLYRNKKKKEVKTNMSKDGFLSIQLSNFEWLSKRRAYTSKTMTNAVINVPKKYAGRRFIVCLPADSKGGDENE